MSPKRKPKKSQPQYQYDVWVAITPPNVRRLMSAFVSGDLKALEGMAVKLVPTVKPTRSKQ